MKVKPMVEREISRIEPGKIFTYNDLPVYLSSPGTTVKTVSRLVQNGEVRRFAKGQFYRPKTGIFGELQLSDNEKMHAFLYRGGKRTGYITGTGLYNRLGLTTQIPRTITIAGNASPQRKNFGTVEIKLVKSKAPVSEFNREYLEILDVLADLKNIPDSQPAFSLKVLSSKLKGFSAIKIRDLVNLAKVYPPVTRALLGLLIENSSSTAAKELKKGLNPTTRYKIGLEGTWGNAREWNIE